MSEREHTVLLNIDDPILRLDIESTFVGAGYRVLLSDSGCLGNEVSIGLIDVDPPNQSALPLICALRARKIPCLLFTGDDLDATIALDLEGLERLPKPLVSDQVLSRVADVVVGRAASGDGIRAWTGDAPAAGSAIG
jgi:hypothetical protein